MTDELAVNRNRVGYRRTNRIVLNFLEYEELAKAIQAYSKRPSDGDLEANIVSVKRMAELTAEIQKDAHALCLDLRPYCDAVTGMSLTIRIKHARLDPTMSIREGAIGGNVTGVIDFEDKFDDNDRAFATTVTVSTADADPQIAVEVPYEDAPAEAPEDIET